MVEYLSAENAIKTNEIVTAAYGQKTVVLQKSNLEHYIDGMQRYAQDATSSRKIVLKKAADILYHLAFNAHAFLNGNKRTALIFALSFASKNLDEFDDSKISDEEKAKIVKEIAEGKHSISFIEKWMEKGLE